MKKVLLFIIGLIILTGCGKNKEVKDYYIYITDSELATVYTLLDLVSNDDKSYIWYTDTSLINVNYLNTDKNVKISKYIGEFNTAIIDEINEFIDDNKKNGRFHLVLDEKYYLLEFALDLDDNYDVRILSRGVESYNNYYEYEFDDGYDIRRWFKIRVGWCLGAAVPHSSMTVIIENTHIPMNDILKRYVVHPQRREAIRGRYASRPTR